ncbi:MAG TPA: hypothetical protein DEO93_06750 [Stenotrophomonas sp.]|nr:hypothetical protein [Stenotrophomonas sp.]
MDVNRLSSTIALISALRRDVVVKGGVATPAAAMQDGVSATARGAAGSMPQLRRQLTELVKGVDLADPVAVRQTRSHFVRTILLWEFGPSLREHPEWRSLMDGVESALDSANNDEQAAFLQLLTSLQPKQR